MIDSVPLGFQRPTSPVCSQPSMTVAFVFSSSFQ
jgi:hypothetical protein